MKSTARDGEDALLLLVRSRGLLDDDRLARWRAAGVPLLQWLITQRVIDGPTAGALAREASTGTPTRVGGAPRTAEPDPEPQLLGRYRIVRELARGGMGVVYDAVDEAIGRRVALKVMRSHDPSEAAIKRLRREAGVAARLAHPGIIGIHDVGVETGPDGEPVHYLVMDLVEGTSWHEAMPSLDRPARLDVLEGVIEALAEAHAAGIVHRDLKPENVLLRASDGRPVLTDFGLARLEDGTQLTRTGAAIGSPLYMAPEQVDGRRDEIGPHTDVWALGVILYELLTDRLPFNARTAAQLYDRIRSAPLPPPGQRAEVPAPLEAVCLRCLQRPPSRRFADAAQLLAAFQAARRGETLAAPRPTLAERLERPAVRWALAGVALVLATALLARALRGRERVDPALRRQALAELAAGRWEAAAATAARAGGDDPALTELIAQCRAQLEAARAAAARGATQAASRQALHALLRPLTREIDEARAATYQPAADPIASLRRVEQVVAKLQALTDDPAHGRQPTLWTELGIACTLAGQPRPAAAALRRAVALDPGARRAHYVLGRVLIEQAMANQFGTGRQTRTDAIGRRAGVHFKAALGGRWDGARPHELQLLRVYQALAFGDEARTRALCREGLQRYPDGLDAEQWHLLLAFSSPRRGRQHHVAKALEIRPHSAWGHFLRGTERLDAGDLDAALADLDRAVALAPQMTVALTNRASALWGLKRPLKALADLDQALRYDPDDPLTYNNRGSMRIKHGDLPGALADMDRALALDDSVALFHVNRASACARLGRHDESRAGLARALELDPELGLAWFNRGIDRLDARDHAAAIEAFTRALAFDERRPRTGARPAIRRGDAHLARGQARQRSGDRTGALADYGQAIRLQPDKARGWLARGRLYGPAAQAEPDLRRAVELAPERADAWLSLATWSVSRRRFAAADEAVGRALRLDPRSVPALALRGRLCHMRNDVAGALDALDRVLRITPDDLGALNNRAMLRLRTGNPAGALADIDRALSRAPGDAASHMYRGNALTALRRGTEAMAAFDRALALARGRVRGEVFLGRSRLHMASERRDRALEDLRAAVAADPRLWNAWFALGGLLTDLGQPDEARQAFGRAVALAPPPMRAQLRRRVDALLGR